MYGQEEIIAIEQPNSLEVNAFNPEKISIMKQDVADILKQNKENLSILESMATGWGKLPWWAKGIGLALLSIPTVVVAIVLQAWFVFAITACVALLYISISLLLDNHYSHNTEINEALEQKVNGFVDFFSTLLTTLYNIKESLKAEVDYFFTENKRLAAQVDALLVQNSLLKVQVQDITETADALKVSNESLEKTVDHLQKTTEKHQDVVNQYEIELEKMKVNHDTQIANFQKEINALTIIRMDLNLQLQLIKSKAKALVNCHSALIATDKKNKESLQVFEGKLDALLEEQNATFNIHLRKIINTSARFNEVVTDLQSLNWKYAQIIIQEQVQLEYIESFVETELRPSVVDMRGTINNRGSNRFFARTCPIEQLQHEKMAACYSVMQAIPLV